MVAANVSNKARVSARLPEMTRVYRSDRTRHGNNIPRRVRLGSVCGEKPTGRRIPAAGFREIGIFVREETSAMIYIYICLGR